MATIQRNLAANSGGLYISKWFTGLYKQRHPLFAPTSAQGLQIIAREDALWDGLNTEISSVMTPIRRPGYSRYSTAQFGSSDYPLAWFSFQNTAGTIKAMVDTPTHVYWFDSSTINSVFSKASTAQTNFSKVGDAVYMCDGNDSDTKKWDGTTVSKWGIVSPVTAPSISLGAGVLSPKIGYLYGYCFKSSTTGHTSSMSPASANTGPQTSQNFTLGGTGSADSQVDKIDIYRTIDGGSTYGLLVTISNPGAGSWNYTDSNADSVVNTFINPPLASSNNPPPSGISLSCFHMSRVWVASGNSLYFGAGPDCVNGVPEEAFPPANRFKLPGKINAMASTTGGLLVFTSDDAYVVLGDSLVTFYVKPWQKNFGVKSQNCVVQDGDLVFILTSKRQLFSIPDLTEVGWSIRANLQTFSPSTSYLALHRNGDDEGLFVGDGTGNVYRYSLALENWSPVAQPVAGIGALGSIEVTTDNWTLMAGRNAGSGYILSRNTSVFQDDGQIYDSYFVLGSIVVAPPGQTASIESILLQCMPVGTYPTVSVLLNEISGTFVDLVHPVPEPPRIAASKSILSNRHYLKSAQTPLAEQQIQHLQIKIRFPIEAARNEVLGLGIS